MNKLEVSITKVQSSGGVTLVDLLSSGYPMSALLIDCSGMPEWLQEGHTITAVFKETEVSIATNFSGNISMRNKLPCIISKIERGELMSLITMKLYTQTINSVITTRSVDLLELNPGDQVIALIKSNEITLIDKL